MGLSVFPVPSAASKTRYVETLLSGSSWTVPANVTYVNATLIGGGGGGGVTDGDFNTTPGMNGGGSQVITTTVTTTPASTISYGIGAGGTAGTGSRGNGGAGGTTTFTGATSALGGNGGRSRSNPGVVGRDGLINSNFGGLSLNPNNDGGAGGAGQIIIEYWV